jgi:hypothetical protein
MKYTHLKIILSLIIVQLILTGSEVKGNEGDRQERNSIVSETVNLERNRVIARADKMISENPETITSFHAPRSTGGPNDFFSEAPYWWPDTANPEGPFTRKDGLRYPDSFKDHDNAVNRFSWIVSTITSAYLLSGDEKYANAAMKHLKAWFIDPETKMNPNWLYGQAIQGINTGRGAGLIDAMPLMDVALSVLYLEDSPSLSDQDIFLIKEWFTEFLHWMTTHQFGINEMNSKNNHGTWWHVQAAAYAKLTDNKVVLKLCHDHFLELLIPNQMASDGSFPAELARTKPYSYSLFNLDALSALAWILTDETYDVWNKNLPDGRGLKKGIDFMLQYIEDISKWPFQKDVQGWESQPGRRSFLLLASIAENKPELFSLWKELDRKDHSDEAIFYLPMRCPLLWLRLKG